MIGEREAEKRRMAAISATGQRSIVFRERRLPTSVRNNRQVSALPSTPMVPGGSLSPLFLSILLIGSQSLVIVVCNILLALTWRGRPRHAGLYGGCNRRARRSRAVLHCQADDPVCRPAIHERQISFPPP